MFMPGSTPVLVIGQFLVLLQLVKLWEQRANRDYAQLLILSLLLMVAASINTASLVFGVMLIAYLFLSLYCCLLFHLKAESDSAKAASPLPEERVNPATLSQDQRYLPRSMRRMTAYVSTVSLASAVLVFVFFPRGTGAGLLGPLQFRPSQSLTGFSEEVSFQHIARIGQNDAVVAHVYLHKNDEPVTDGRELLLRGITLDTYRGNNSARGRWQWARSQMAEGELSVEANDTLVVEDDKPADRWRQHITLKPTGSSVLFAVAGPVSITPKRDLRLRYAEWDGVIQAGETLTRELEYEVVSRGDLNRPGPRPAEPYRQRTGGLPADQVNRRIYDYAMKADVSGADDAGQALAAGRPRDQRGPHELDEQIARNIEQHLQSQFTYTLDLTDVRRLADEDPMVRFLHEFKRGHCEYFAGAMTLMCQSLGMRARMVIGFKCDEFNEWDNYYIVRQRHAHAWVEVLTADGWQTFDPTSGREDLGAAARAGAWQRVKHFFNWLEFTYGKSVIAYDNENRRSLIQEVENRMADSAVRGNTTVNRVRRWMTSNDIDALASKAVFVFFTLMIVTLAAFVGWFLWERWTLRRRAARIGLESLPPADQARLARQLGFYDDLVKLLARHQISRPRHLTPMEFARSLSFLPSDAYAAVLRLTDIFYRVRYGRAELHPGQQRRLSTVINRLSPCVAGAAARA
jgi:hypothetical protein